jgi:hypothetical protein
MSKLDDELCELVWAYDSGAHVSDAGIKPNKDKIKALFLELVGEAPPCEENCTEERHAYHRGAYEFAEQLREKINKL